LSLGPPTCYNIIKEKEGENMNFVKGHYYLYQDNVYVFLGSTTFDSGYTLYFFENEFNMITLGETEILEVKEY
jgi:hypothetical protein